MQCLKVSKVVVSFKNKVNLVVWKLTSTDRSSCSQMFFKKGVFTRKHLCWSLFLIKQEAFRLKKETPTHVFSWKYCIFLKNSLFIEHFRWLLLFLSVLQNCYRALFATLTNIYDGVIFPSTTLFFYKQPELDSQHHK